jgi:hypothetical protein
MFHGLIFNSSSSSIGTTNLVGFGLLNCRWTFTAGRFYRVPLPAARLTPNLEENQEFRAFQLSPQEAPSVWSDASEPNSGRWNYGRETAERILPKVATSTSLLGSFTCRKARHGTEGFTSPPKVSVLRIFFARKIRRRRPCLNPRTRVPKASTLPLDHRSQFIFNYTFKTSRT